MSGQSPIPKLVMGHIVVSTPDDEEGIPYDEAVIHFEGDEDSEIEVRCPGALRVAPLIVRAVNSHTDLVTALDAAVAALRSSAGPDEIQNAEREGKALLAKVRATA